MDQQSAISTFRKVGLVFFLRSLGLLVTLDQKFVPYQEIYQTTSPV
jgi:hypothetical protein